MNFLNKKANTYQLLFIKFIIHQNNLLEEKPRFRANFI